MWLPESTVVAILCSLLLSSLVQIVDSSVLNRFGPLSLVLPRNFNASSPSSLSNINETWPIFPFTVAVKQGDSTPEWLRFSFGGQAGTQRQSLILCKIIDKVSATFASSPLDILNDMSGISDQDVHILFKITPLELSGNSFSTALENIAAYVRQWGAKEMDFEIGSGPKNLTTEGIFQIRLGSGSFTVGTGISTSLPFSTVLSLPFSTISDTISPTTSHASATPGPSTSASRGSLQFTSTNTSRPAFDNNYWNTGKSLSRPSGTGSTPSLMLNTSYRTSQSLTQTSSPAGPGRVNLTSLDVITPILTTSLGKLSTAGAGESTHTISNVSLYASPTVIPKSGTDGTGQATLPSANASTRTSRMSQSKPSVTGSIRPSLLLISSTGVCYTGSCHHTSNASLHTPTASMTRSNTPPQSVGSLGNLFGNSYGLSGRQSISTSESIATGGATVNSTSLGSSTGLVSVSSSLSKSSYPSATISSSSTVFQTSSTSSASLLPVPTSTPIPTTSSDSASGVFTTVWISSTIQSSVGVTTKGHTTRDAGSNGPLVVFPLIAPVEAPVVEFVPIVEPFLPGKGGQGTNPNNGNGNDDGPQDEENQPTTQPSGSRTTTQPSITTFTSMSMTSQTSVTTSCSACGACQGYTYGTYILASNLTDPDGDDGDDAGLDDDDATSDDEDDGTTGTKKRSFVRRKGRYQAGSGEPHKGRGLAGRFSIQDPKPTLVKRGKTTNTVGGCKVGHDYQAKPPYPNAQSVQAFEGIQKNGYTRMSGFYQTAAYWAVPSDVPLETCDTPTWSYKKTVEIQAIKNPGPWQFKAVAGNRYVDIDHVYEAKFLTDFMGNLVRTGQRSCPAINNEWGVLAGEEPRSIPAGAPGGKLKGQLPTRLNVLFSMLASFDHPEFVGMASPMNTLKGLVPNWRWSPPVKITGTAFDLDALGDLFILLDVYNTDIVLSLWEITNARIYAAFQSFDTQTKPACNSENQFLYAPVYKDWITNRIATMNQNLQSFITSALKGVPTNDQIVAERLSSLTAKYPAARMTIPSPRYWTPKDPNSPIVNGVVNWGQAAQPGGLDKRANSGACLSSKDSSISTSAASGDTVSNGNKIPFGTGNININGLGLAKTLASPRTTPMIMTTLTSSPTLPTTTPPTSSPYTITTPTSSPALPATSPLTSSALPVATSATASTSAAAAISSNGDPCGPAKQEPGFQSTCSTSVSLATTPQQYGVYCGVSVNTVLQHTACETAYKTLCENIQWSGFPTGAWVWSDPGRGCAAGVWIPSYDGAAMIPSLERCTDLIYQAMVQSCQPDVITSNFAGIVASVNLATLPSFDDVTQTGSQVNVGYPSYMIAPKSPVGLSETWAGWTTGQAGSEGALAGMNPHDQDITPQAYKVPDDTITA